MFKKLKQIFSKPSTEREESYADEIYIRLNEKVLPIARGEIYEDPLAAFLAENNIGEIVNSGTMQSKDGEVEFCDFDISLNELGEGRNSAIGQIVSFLEEKGAPIGSTLLEKINGNETKIGKLEGIGVYLNGTDLPDYVYKESDINYVVEKLQKLLGLETQELRYWQGNTETALYFYGMSFESMKESILEFLSTYPLCQKCRVVQIA